MKLPDTSIASCDDASCELLISPIPRPRVQTLQVSTRPKQRRVTLIDSRKSNSIVVLREVANMLRARDIAVTAEIRVKDDPADVRGDAVSVGTRRHAANAEDTDEPRARRCGPSITALTRAPPGISVPGSGSRHDACLQPDLAKDRGNEERTR